MAHLTARWRKRPDALAVIGLLLLPVAILGRALLPGKVLSPADNLLAFFPWKVIAPGHVPANPLLGDVTFHLHPALIYAAREIREGRFPLWNPHAFAGAPFFANPQSALLFPLNALAYLLPVPAALTLISILKLSAAGAGMYWFLSLLSVGRLAATVGAIAFMFNGVLIVWLQWPLGSSVVCLPLLFGMTERLFQRGNLRTVAGLAIAVAVSIFAGYPQGAFHGSLATGAYAVCRAVGSASPLSFLTRFAAGTGLGVAIAGVQLFPFLEYLRTSSVFAYRAEWMPVVSLPARSVITLLMPYYYGSPTGGDFWGHWSFNDISASVGLAPLVVLPATLAAAWSRTGTKFFVGLAGLTGAMVYGMPVVTPALAGFPPLSLAANHRVVTLFVFSLCALCAIGLDAIAKSPRGAIRGAEAGVKLMFVTLTGIAFFFVVDDYPAIARTAMKVSVFVQYLGFLGLLTLTTLLVLRLFRDGGGASRWWLPLILAQLASVLPPAATYNPVIDARLLYPAPPPAIRYLRHQSARDLGRVIPGEVWNTGMLYGFFEVAGHDGMTPRRVEEVASPAKSVGFLGSLALTVTTGFSSPVFDLLGIRHVVVAPGGTAPAPHFSLEYDGPDARIYRNDRALPRAFLASRARRCVDDAAGLRLMREGALDFREEVLVAQCEGAPAAGPRGRVSNAEIRQYRSHRVVIHAMTDSPAYLVLTDTWFPGWRARVNGVEQPVWRANHAFRAVWLPPGRHEVEFRYRPASFQFGLGLSALAACAALGLCLGSRGPHE